MHRISAAAAARMILTAVYTFIAVLMQCSVFPHLRFLGAIPEFTLCVIVCVSCFEDEKFSCILAVAAGFLLDTVGGDAYTLSPVLFLLAACFSIILSHRITTTKIIPAAISGGTALIVGAAKATLILAGKGAAFSAVIVKTALPQLLYGLIVLIPAFLLTALHYRVFRGSFEQSRRRAREREVI